MYSIVSNHHISVSYIDSATNSCSVNESYCLQIFMTNDEETYFNNHFVISENIVHNTGQCGAYETKGGVGHVNSACDTSINEGGDQTNGMACSTDNDFKEDNGGLEGSLLLDINHNCDFEGFDLFNVVKNGWKIYSLLLESTCTDFKAWKSQTDFDFGFILFNSLVVPKNQSHIVHDISDPIQQHYYVKKQECQIA